MILSAKKDPEMNRIKQKFHDNRHHIKLNKKNLNIFFNYIIERHLIYKRRFINSSPAPWTKNSILKKYKFTNVFRDLDTGTIYVIKKIIPRCSTLDKILFNLIIYRLYNRITTFESVGIQNPNMFSHIKFESKLRKLKGSRIPVFTNAFTVSSYHWIDPNSDKISNTVKMIKLINDDIYNLTEKIISIKNSKNTYQTLLKIKGIGKFLAYQISVDLGYWNKDIFDESIFVIAGPGCRKGINYIFNAKGGLSYEECIFYIEKIQDEEFRKLKIDLSELFNDRIEKRLNIMAIENCFCEVSKYLKVYYNEGRPRNRFIPKRVSNGYI